MNRRNLVNTRSKTNFPNVAISTGIISLILLLSKKKDLKTSEFKSQYGEAFFGLDYASIRDCSVYSNDFLELLGWAFLY